MTGDHVPDEVILCVFDHTEGHDVKEGIAISIWDKRVSTSPDQLLESVFVQLSGSNMDWELALGISDVRIWISMFDDGLDHEGISPHDGLVQS